MLLRISISFLIAFTVFAAPAVSGEYDKVRTVAVISALGNDFKMLNFGMNPISHDRYTLHTEWNLDAQVSDLMAKALGSRFAVKPVTADPQMFANFREALGNSFWHQIGDRLKTLPRLDGVDAYVVAFPDPIDPVPPLEIFGLTVMHEHTIFSTRTTMYASYLVGVFDSSTGEMIDYGSAQYPYSGNITGHEPPVERCANDMWSESDAQYTAEQKSRLRQEMASLITRSIAYTLASAKLISKAEAETFTAQNALTGEPSCHRA